MAPMKLEDNMKERLEERRIEPTAAAWDRISDKLEAANGKKNSNFLLWTAIAASFIGGVFITLLILNGQRSESPDFVETPVQEEVQDSKMDLRVEAPEVTLPNKTEQVAVVAQVQEEKTTTKVTEKETTAPPTYKEVIQQETTGSINEAVAMANTPKKDTKLENKPNTLFQDPLDKAVQEEVASIVAQIDAKTVTDEEIDALLLTAQRDIISNQMFNQKTNKVDANALLLDVESEVDPSSFKDKVYGALKDGFIKAREAVADRNN